MRLSFESSTDTLLARDTGTITLVRARGKQAMYVVEPVDGRARATVLFIHGLSEHALRFLSFAHALALEGYRVVLFHLHGHGVLAHEVHWIHWLAEQYLKGNAQEAIQRIGEMGSELRRQLSAINDRNTQRMAATQMFEHIAQVETIVGTMYDKAEPIFIAGHSLGGLLAAAAGHHLAHTGIAKPAGVILLSPGLRPIAPPHTGVIGQAVVNLSWASRRHTALQPVGWLLRAIMRTNLRLKTGWAHSQISDIQPECDLHRCDPLILNRITTAYLSRIEALMARTHEQAADYPCDVILFAGDRDAIVDTRGSLTFMKTIHTRRAPAGNPIIIYPGVYAHSPLHSTQRGDVIQRLLPWMRARLGQHAQN